VTLIIRHSERGKGIVIGPSGNVVIALRIIGPIVICINAGVIVIVIVVDVAVAVAVAPLLLLLPSMMGDGAAIPELLAAAAALLAEPLTCALLLLPTSSSSPPSTRLLFALGPAPPSSPAGALER